MNQTAIISYCDFLEGLQDFKEKSCIGFMVHCVMGAANPTLDPLSYALCAVRELEQHIQHDEYRRVHICSGKL